MTVTYACTKCTRWQTFAGKDAQVLIMAAEAKGWRRRLGKTICGKCK